VERDLPCGTCLMEDVPHVRGAPLRSPACPTRLFLTKSSDYPKLMDVQYRPTSPHVIFVPARVSVILGFRSPQRLNVSCGLEGPWDIRKPPTPVYLRLSTSFFHRGAPDGVLSRRRHSLVISHAQQSRIPGACVRVAEGRAGDRTQRIPKNTAHILSQVL